MGELREGDSVTFLWPRYRELVGQVKRVSGEEAVVHVSGDGFYLVPLARARAVRAVNRTEEVR